MSYQANIPQATDSFTKSQGDILGNFTALEAFMIVNHYDPNSANAGKHLQVNFPLVLANAPGTAAGEVCIYPATGYAGVPALFFQPQGISADTPGTDFTSVVVAGTQGYTYLPSGVLLQWGIATPSASVPVTVTLGASYSSSAYSVQVSLGSNGANPAYWVSYDSSGGAITASSFKVRTNSTSAVQVRWFTIGIGA